MKFILLGFEFESSNKGCEALSYAVISFLNSVEEFKPLEIVNINIHDSMGEIPTVYPDICFKNIRMRIKRPSFWKQCKKEISDTVAVLDITHGDSFSDIYGEKWFATTTLVKTFFALCRKPFILMPQTYGPYKKKWAEKWAKFVIMRADRVYTRDNISKKYLEEMGISRNVFNTVDLAFLLPFEKKNRTSNRIRVGMNVSGLLWDDCLKGNRFGLATNYCEYCRNLLSKLYNDQRYEISFIPHVLCDPREGVDFFENDSKAIRELLKEYPNCYFPNDFKTALDVKNYIAEMDILIAARMHASIAAFSANVAVIPFAYSRKFEGVYNDLDYPFVIDGKKSSTNDSVGKTMEYIASFEDLKKSEEPGNDTLQRAQKSFFDDFKRFISKSRSSVDTQ